MALRSVMARMAIAIALFLPLTTVHSSPLSKLDRDQQFREWAVTSGNFTAFPTATSPTITVMMGNWTRTATSSDTIAHVSVTAMNATRSEEVWRVKLGDICQITRFPLPSGEAARYVECVKPTKDEKKWPWGDKGIWMLKQCPAGSEFHLMSQMCRSRRYIRRQQSVCAVNPAAQYCPQPMQPQYSVQQQQQQQLMCQCPPGVSVCACPQPTVIQPQPHAQQVACPPIPCPQQPCPAPPVYCPQPPQPCPLAPHGAAAAEGDLCSWMLAPLCADPTSNKCFLQCVPAPGNAYCGRWVRMPCAPATIFDVNLQVCVHDPYNVPGPVPPWSAANQVTQQATCNVGTNIGSCNTNFQCPGQSVCQVTQQITPACQQAPQSCTTCCYTGGVGAPGSGLGFGKK